MRIINFCADGRETRDLPFLGGQTPEDTLLVQPDHIGNCGDDEHGGVHRLLRREQLSVPLQVLEKQSKIG